MNLEILGTGSAVPDLHVSNVDLESVIDTNDEWIKERTGIGARYIARDDDATTLAVKAAKKAIEAASIDPAEIDVVIACTTSGTDLLPCIACKVQAEIGAVNAYGFDISAACTGFMIAMATAQGYMEAGICKTALLIGTEQLSKIMNWSDRGSCILFGDGAGAAVVRAGQGKKYLPAIHSDGLGGDALICKTLYSEDTVLDEIRNFKNEDGVAKTDKVTMDGKAVFQFAIKQVPIVIKEVLEKNEVSLDDVDLFVLHQANKRIIESIARRLKQPEEKFPTNVAEYGNTSSASIPILLDELVRNGHVKKGMKLCMAGFGAGLTWGAMIIDY